MSIDLKLESQMAKLTIVLVSRIKKEHAGQNWQGLETCPVCNGKLYLSHAAQSGKVHGQCITTEGCLSWME